MFAVLSNRKSFWNIIFVFQIISSLFMPRVLLAEGTASENSSPKVTGRNTKETKNSTSKVVTDLAEILKRGTLRIIVPSNLSGGLFLPRSDSPMDKQQALAIGFARSLGVKPEIVPVLSFRDMLPALKEGRGDILVANMTITEKRKEKLAFSVPVDHAHQVVIVGKQNTGIKITKDLKGKSLLLDKGTTFWKTGEDFKKRYPEMNLVAQKDGLFDESALDLVAEGKYDATIRDSNIAEMYLTYRDDLRIAFNASSEQSLAFGLRHESIQLKKVLDKYLTQEKLSTHHEKEYFGDLDDIKKRGVLRVLLKNNASSYFLRRGQLMGFEYEMAKAFAKHLDVRLVVLVPPNSDQALDWLEKGKVDIAAGFLKPSAQWQKRGIAASTPYHQAFQHIVVKKSNKDIKSVADLDGKTVVVHKSSDYWKELEGLSGVGIHVKLQAAPEDMEEEEIIDKIASGDYEITLVDKHLLDIEVANRIAVKSAFRFGDQKSHALAVRAEDKQLLSSIDQYIKSKKDGKMYDRLYAKYFTDTKQIQRNQRSRLRTSEGKKMISRYDPLVREFSEKYGFDWRFITAQMFQESRFDPNARSHAGAIGLMQLMPKTARQLGFSGLKNPKTNIHAGTKYMNWLYDRFDAGLPVVDRMWFTLASYNAGLGHVLDARRLARQLGLNEDRWFDNVEKAMLLLSKKKYARKARYGYVRGREPVGYVQIIMRLYASYINIIGLEQDLIKIPGDLIANADSAASFDQQLNSLYSDIENHPACCR